MVYYSKQREEILDLLKKVSNHPTAEEIYITLNKQGSSSSRSTVYRNLGILSENEEIRKITVMDAPDRYDYIWQEHHHVICPSCKKIYDFEYDFGLEKLKKFLKEKMNIEISGNNLTLPGLCSNCQEKSSKEREKK